MTRTPSRREPLRLHSRAVPRAAGGAGRAGRPAAREWRRTGVPITARAVTGPEKTGPTAVVGGQDRGGDRCRRGYPPAGRPTRNGGRRLGPAPAPMEGDSTSDSPGPRPFARPFPNPPGAAPSPDPTPTPPITRPQARHQSSVRPLTSEPGPHLRYCSPGPDRPSVLYIPLYRTSE